MIRSRSALAFLAALVTACSSGSDDGGGDTQIQGLSGPEAVSIVEADESDVATGGNPSGGPSGSTYPPDSAYSTDGANIHVFDPSMRDLDQGNQILCMLSLTAYSEMVNQGAYLAQVDEGLCEAGEEDDDADNQSSAVSQDLLFFTVDARRQANDGAQVNQFWVPVNAGAGDEELLIHAKMDVTQAPSSSNPFGRFTLNYAGVPDGGTVATAEMIGVLQDNGLSTPGYEFVEVFGDVDVAHSPGDFSREVLVNVSMDSSLNSGAARIQTTERANYGMGDLGQRVRDIKVVFNETHLKRAVDGGSEVTLSRTDYTNHVYRYNLYHADGNDIGERVQLNSGFGIRTSDGYFGWAGYWGLWLPPEADAMDGDTVFRNEFGDSNEQAYTLRIAPGRLVEFSRNTLALTDLAGQLFEWWDSGNQYQVDYSAPDFRRVAQYNFSTDSWDPIDPPTLIDVSSLGGFLSMWSPSLGGPVSYVDGASDITYFAETFVNSASDLVTGASGGSAQLFGLVECLKAGITASEAETGDVYLPDASSTSTPYSYRFSTSDLTLRYDPAGDGSSLSVVGLAEGEVPTGGPNHWGMRSGPLVPDTSGLTNIYDIWNESLFYVYETGHNDWNRHVEILDSMNNVVSFDKPIEFLYTHSVANDMNDDATYANQQFLFSYQGPGNLHGIQYDPVDLDGDSEEDRWYPRFSLKDGVLMGPTGTEYVVRAIEVEQTLNEDPSGSAALDLSAADLLVLPSESDYVAPNIGDQPDVDGAPAVIDGEVQE